MLRRYSRSILVGFLVIASTLQPQLALGEAPPCSDAYAIIARQLERYTLYIPEQHLTAVHNVLNKHFRLMMEALSPEERMRFAQIIQDAEVKNGVVGAGAQVARHEDSGKIDVSFDPATVKSPIAVITLIHEAQHLRDLILKPASLQNAKSETKRLESHAFLRQQALITDLVNEIGIDGITDIMMYAGKVPEKLRPETKKLFGLAIKKPADGLFTDEEKRLYKIFFKHFANDKALGEATLGYLWKVENRSVYVRQFLNQPMYANKIRIVLGIEDAVSQEKQLEEMVKKLNEMKSSLARQRAYRLLIATIVGGIAGAYLVETLHSEVPAHVEEKK